MFASMTQRALPTISDLAMVLKRLPRNSPLVLKVGGKLYPWDHVTAGYFTRELATRTSNSGEYTVIVVAGEASNGS